MRVVIFLLLAIAFCEGAKIPLSPSFESPSNVGPLTPTQFIPAATPVRDINVERKDAFDNFVPFDNAQFDPSQFEVDSNEIIPKPQAFEIDFRPSDDKPNCIPETVTSTLLETTVIPSTSIKYNRIDLPTTYTVTATDFSTRIVTQNVVDKYMIGFLRTQFDVISTTVTVVSSYTTTLTSASTLVKTAFKTVVDTQTVINTLLTTNTVYQSNFITKSSTLTSYVPVTSTVVNTVPGPVQTFTSIRYFTSPIVRNLPGAFVYVSTSVDTTVTNTATQVLRPETIQETTSVVLPSYVNIPQPIYVTRTSTQVDEISRTAIVSTSVFNYITVTKTVSSIQFVSQTITSQQITLSTSTQTSYVDVTVTQDVPRFTTVTKTSTSIQYSTVTRPGGTFTTVSTVIEVKALTKTHTNIMPTPIAYESVTISSNCFN